MVGPDRFLGYAAFKKILKATVLKPILSVHIKKSKSLGFYLDTGVNFYLGRRHTLNFYVCAVS